MLGTHYYSIAQSQYDCLNVYPLGELGIMKPKDLPSHLHLRKRWVHQQNQKLCDSKLNDI